MLNNERPLEQMPSNEQKDETRLPSSPNSGNTNVMCSLLSYHNEFVEFGFKCYNDGLYDGQVNIIGGQSICQKFNDFLLSRNLP